MLGQNIVKYVVFRENCIESTKIVKNVSYSKKKYISTENAKTHLILITRIFFFKGY